MFSLFDDALDGFEQVAVYSLTILDRYTNTYQMKMLCIDIQYVAFGIDWF
jgi:hypothetical protein